MAGLVDWCVILIIYWWLSFSTEPPFEHKTDGDKKRKLMKVDSIELI